MGQHRRTLNIWVAYTMPILMVGLVGYATWIFLSLICIHYLLREQKRTITAGVLFGIYIVLFLLLAASYLRTVVTVTVSPGYVRKGPHNEKLVGEKSQIDGIDDDLETGFGGTAVLDIPASDRSTDLLRVPTEASLNTVLRTGPPQFPPPVMTPRELGAPVAYQAPMSNTVLHPHASRQAPNNQVQNKPYWVPARPLSTSLPPNLREFLNKDIYVCESDGLPRYCQHCNCWKPDRSHHCSEVGRCVWKMDHFCPWVGGVVAETSFRYFYQVVVYGTLYCVFLVTTMGVFITERNKNDDNIDSKWVATIALASVFGMFSAGMAFSTTQLIVGNVSTIDSLSAQTKVYQLAIHDPNPLPPSPTLDNPGAYKRRVWLPLDPSPGEHQRCFAIVRTEPGENPWKLNSTYENFKEALGGSLWQWFLLWGMPKPGSGGGEDGWYRWNSDIIGRLKKDAGIQVEYNREKVRG